MRRHGPPAESFPVFDPTGDGRTSPMEWEQACARLGVSPRSAEQLFRQVDTDGDGVISEEESPVFYAILVPAHLYFRDFSACTPVFFAILVPAHLYFSRCAMRERERKIAKKSRKNHEKTRQIARETRKNREIANGTRLFAHRSRWLRSRSLAHRVRYRCAGTNIA